METFEELQVGDALRGLVARAIDRAIEGVSTGEGLVPTVHTLSSDGSERVHELMAADIPGAEQLLFELLSDPCVLAYAYATDQLLHEHGTKRDAIVVEAAERGSPHGVMFFQRYQKKQLGRSFGPLGKPTLTDSELDNRFAGSSGAGVHAGSGGALSSEEWRILRMAPVLVLLAVAAPERSVDEQSLACFREVLAFGTALRSRLMRQVLAEVIDELPGCVRRAVGDALDPTHALHGVGELVDAKFARDDALAFKSALLQIGKRAIEKCAPPREPGHDAAEEGKVALAALFVALRFRG